MSTGRIWWLARGAWVVQTPDGRAYCWDTSWTRHANLPWLLNHVGVREATIIHSHPHFDHVTGTPWIAQRFGPGLRRVISSGVYATGAHFAGPNLAHQDVIWDTLDDLGVQHDFMEYGDNIDGWFDVLAPHRELLDLLDTDARGRYLTGSVTTPNPTSLMCRLVHGDFSFLFTGDITVDGQQYAINKGATMKSTLWQVPHHGDYTNTNEQIAQTVDSDLAIMEDSPHIPETKVALDEWEIPWVHLEPGGITEIEFDDTGAYSITQGLKPARMSRGAML